eukprot:scaffold89791_cov50-Phaeocystis_antarctica.AAC.1
MAFEDRCESVHLEGSCMGIWVGTGAALNSHPILRAGTNCALAGPCALGEAYEGPCLLVACDIAASGQCADAD